jgi:endoglucanase
MVKSIDDEGIVRISEVGGIEPLTILNERVEIQGKPSVIGMITTREISDGHFFSDSGAPTMREMYTDTGLTKKQLEARGITVGSYITFYTKACFLGNKKYISGKALDDRVGCYILLELAKRLKKTKNEVQLVFTVQEEVGLYGAKISAYEMNPQLAIAVDVVNANDRSRDVTKELGKGPTITIKDSGMITDRHLDFWIRKIAKTNKIPIQPEVSDLGTTDALSISLTKGGIPATVVGIAIRNIHTTRGIAHVDDIENCIKLLEALIKNMPEGFSIKHK